MPVIQCTQIDETRDGINTFFKVGAYYQAHFNVTGLLFQLFDEHGNNKFIGVDDLRYPLGETNKYAHFKLVNPQKELQRTGKWPMGRQTGR